jgi:hypothetical protein
MQQEPGIAGRRWRDRSSLSMAKSTHPAKSGESAKSGEPTKSRKPTKSRELKGGSAPAARRATPTAVRKPARSEAKPDAPAVPDRPRPPQAISESAHRVLQPPPAVAADLDPAPPPSAGGASDEPTMASPASAGSAGGEPTMASPAEVRADIAEPPPPVSPSVDEPPGAPAAAAAPPEPVAAAAELALVNAAMVWPSRSLVEGGIRIRSEMIAFTWQQTEHGLALGRAVVASRSLPEILALQTAYLGETLERTLAHTLELARLSTDMLRTGLQAPRAD